MHRLKKLAFLILAAVLLTVPTIGFCLEVKRPNPPMVQMLQEGKAKLSPDYKNLIDDKGKSVAKETSNTTKNKETTALSSDYHVKDPSAPLPPMIIFCNKKCAIVSRHCYVDDTGNIVCLNVCEKESLVCE